MGARLGRDWRGQGQGQIQWETTTALRLFKTLISKLREPPVNLQCMLF